jgi:hypothetical protein
MRNAPSRTPSSFVTGNTRCRVDSEARKISCNDMVGRTCTKRRTIRGIQMLSDGSVQGQRLGAAIRGTTRSLDSLPRMDGNNRPRPVRPPKSEDPRPEQPAQHRYAERNLGSRRCCLRRPSPGPGYRPSTCPIRAAMTERRARLPPRLCGCLDFLPRRQRRQDRSRLFQPHVRRKNAPGRLCVRRSARP